MIIDYTNRRFIIFEVSELNNINFKEIYETSTETVRKSVDQLKTFVEYDLPMPASVQSLTTKSDELTIEEITQILNTEEWAYPELEFNFNITNQ